MGIRRNLVGVVAGSLVADNQVEGDSPAEMGSLVGEDNRVEGGILVVVDSLVVGDTLSTVDLGNLVRSLVAPLLFTIRKLVIPFLVHFTRP